nr:hypothetical protein [Paenibacillus endoradicis]
MEITNEFLLAYEQWKTGDITAVGVMMRLDMTKSTFYRKVKEYELKK